MKQGCRLYFFNCRIGRQLLGAMLCALAFFANGAPPVSLLLSGDQSYYQEVSAVFKATLAVQPNAPVVHVYDLDQALHMPPNSTVVAIGSQASKFALSHFPSADTLSLLMPQVAWDELRLRFPGSGRRAAVVIDQPLERSLALAKLLVPQAKQVGAVFGPVSVASKPSLLEATQNSGMTLVYEHLDNDDNPIGVLTPLVKKIDVFITIADRGVFNKSVAKWLLYLSFRQKVSVIGFSQSYVKAGALAAVYSSPENIGRHGAELVSSLLASEGKAQVVDDRWKTHYPEYYTLEVNREVANALKIAVPEFEDLYREYQFVLESVQ